MALAFISSPAFAQVSISIDVAPPPLIVEDQPPVPDDGYIWTPGYWAYDEDQGSYYWVDGAWVQPPEVGLYWTPNYWGWNGNAYVYYPGYWGPTVGFYGGVNYGHGYGGNGYGGGRWDNGHFDYNTAANNVAGGHVHNTYADRSAVRSQSKRVSFNGGKGGIKAQPTPQQQQASQQSHVQPTAQQQAHFQTAAQTRSHQVKVNAHKPATANVAQPAGSSQFTGQNAQEQKKDAGAAPMPVQHEPQVSPVNQAQPEAKPQVMNEEHTPVKNVEQPAPAQPKMEEKPAQVSEHMAPPSESHAAQAPGGEQKQDRPAAAPQPHPQAQPHPEAKPQGNAQPKSDGQGKSDSHQDNGQH
jgi:hypothetical protein